MKKILLLLTVFLLVSCASKPKPEPDPVPEPRPEPPAQIAVPSVPAEPEKTEPIIVESTEGLEAAKITLVDADAARQKALSVKAQNAAKSDFMKAQALYDDGKSAYGKKEYLIAADKWTESIPIFNLSHDNALVARDRALAALEDAKKAIDDAETSLSDDSEQPVDTER